MAPMKATPGVFSPDGEAVVSLMQRVVACDSPETLASTVVHAIPQLIPTHACGWIEIHADSGYSYGTMNVPVDPAVVAREMNAVIHAHPVFQAFMRTRDGQARAISDLVSRRTFQTSDLYLKFLGKYRSEDQLCVAEAFDGIRLVTLTLNRDTWGFTEREKTLLNALRPVLFQTFRRLRQLADYSLAHDGVSLGPETRSVLIATLMTKGLTRREAEVTALLTEGACNHEIAKTLGISQGTVRKHVDRVFLKLGVHNRTAATRAALALLGSASEHNVLVGEAPMSVAPGG